jgi:hypothetical protein
MARTSEKTVPRASDGRLISATVVDRPARTRSVYYFMEHAACGDIVLFQGESAISHLICTALRSPYSHIGVVVDVGADGVPPAMLARSTLPRSAPRRWRGLCMLHATDFTRCPSLLVPTGDYVGGVQCNLLWDMLVRYHGRVVARHLRVCARGDVATQVALLDDGDDGTYTAPMLERVRMRCGARAPARTLHDLVCQLSGRAYEHNVFRLALIVTPHLQSWLAPRGGTIDGDDSFYCSELTAIVLHMLSGGALVNLNRVQPEQFAPHAFASSAVQPTSLRDDTALYALSMEQALQSVVDDAGGTPPAALLQDWR